MTEKNIFAYKPFFSLNISDSIFYVKIATPPEKSHPLFPSNPTLKVKVLSSPFFENLVGGSPPPSRPNAERGEGGGGEVHTMPFTG